jgi:hypothetical protein
MVLGEQLLHMMLHIFICIYTFLLLHVSPLDLAYDYQYVI